MVYKVEGATPIRLAFWGSVGPRDLKPAAIRAGACVAARQPGWARRVCGRPAGGPDGHAVCRRFGSNNWYQSQVGPVHSQDKSRPRICQIILVPVVSLSVSVALL
jgi:hypothetical protein